MGACTALLLAACPGPVDPEEWRDGGSGGGTGGNTGGGTGGGTGGASFRAIDLGTTANLRGITSSARVSNRGVVVVGDDRTCRTNTSDRLTMFQLMSPWGDCNLPNVEGELRSISSASSENIVIVGRSPLPILQYVKIPTEPGSWVPVPHQTAAGFNAVAALSNGWFIFGGAGVAYSAGWSTEPTLKPFALSPKSSSDFLAATSDQGLRGSNEWQVWAVGKAGTIYTVRSDARVRELTAEASGTTEDLNAVVAVPALDGGGVEVIAVGNNGVVLRRDSRGTWSRESIASAPSAHLYGVFRSLIARGGAGPRAGPGNACAVGESGTVLCRDASGRWALVPTPTGETLRAGVGLFFPALGEGFADLIVGDRGTVLLR